MACNCIKRTISLHDRARIEARKLSELEKADYVIYDEKGRIYTDRRSCWEKAGRPGTLREIVCYL